MTIVYTIPLRRPIHPLIIWPLCIGLGLLMIGSTTLTVISAVRYYTKPRSTTSPPAHHRTHKPAASHPA